MEWIAGGMLRRVPDCVPAHPRLEGERKDRVSARVAWSPEVEGAWRFLGTGGVGGRADVDSEKGAESQPGHMGSGGCGAAARGSHL